jgi:hypothetical protein
MTITAAAACPTLADFGPGCSETFYILRSAIFDFRKHRDESIVLGWRQELRNRLVDLIQEASEPAWDGYHAEPVTDLAIATAHYLISLLPETMPLPDVVPTPDGEIAFEWDHSSNYFFTVTTNQGLLIYAGILGPDRKQYGQEPLNDELPGSIAKILGSYFSKI